ncbi:polysaccharide lyase family 14 protein [Lyophyllum atratum]|nr:polysaccharide lyase family 14 protein [Lyophyllum atratum]
MSPNPHLLPISHFKHGFTTSPHLKHPHSHLTHVPLSDSALGVHKTTSRLPHPVVTPPPPQHKATDALPPPDKAWEALYPKGSINPSAAIPGGFGFYLSGPETFKAELEKGAREVVFGYRMMLEPGWEFKRGGKLPGVFGGVGDLAYHCSGGRQENRCQCFDLRPMWRRQGVGELYTYLPLTPSNSTLLLSTPPESVGNSDFGFSVGRKSFSLDIAIGRWVALAFRVRMNDLGKCNGEIEVWVDGVSSIHVKDLCLCDSAEARVKGMHFQTFFGGHSEEWCCPKDQRAWFADVTGAIVA